MIWIVVPGVTFAGEQYGLPYTYYQWGVYYRKDIFDQNRYLAGTDRRRADELMELGARCATRPRLDDGSPEEILGYDDVGLPTSGAEGYQGRGYTPAGFGTGNVHDAAPPPHGSGKKGQR